MSDSVKQQVIEDLQMAGLAPSTQKIYLAIIVRFVNRTRIRPQDATEAQVAEYLRGLIRQGQCQGTVRPVRSALQFVFQNTLGRQWPLFKKGSPPRVASVCPMPPVMPSAVALSPRSAGPRTVSAWR
jgi:Phage integrase, N-terminal SAM-like domain